MNKHLQILGLVIIGVVFYFAGLGFFTFVFKQPSQPNNGVSQFPMYTEPKTYEECAKLSGSKILEMYPPVCVTTSGQRFTQATVVEIKTDY